MSSFIIVEELGSGPLDTLAFALFERFGDSHVTRTVDQGVAVRSNFDIEYAGKTQLRNYVSAKKSIAITQIGKDPERYFAYVYTEMSGKKS